MFDFPLVDVAAQALGSLFQIKSLLLLVTGVAVGLVIGILPGLGGTVGMSILIPFIFGMQPDAAIPLLIGMAAVVHTGDTFPSVLIGVPGSSGSQATICDGYPLAQKGEAARALGAAFFASMIGGVFGAFVLFLILPVARPLVLAFGSPELLMLSLLGLSMAGVLAGNKPMRGLIVAGLGLFVGAIGAAPAVAEYRFTAGLPYLWDGIPIAVIALGLFALPEMMDLLAARQTIAKRATIAGGWLQGLKDVIANKWLVLRCSGIGVVVGVIPGLGGSVVDWISYGQVVQTSKDKSMFGKGDIRGVIAPESSNNAKEGGALIPTLLFGIPGSGATAILLGAFILVGLEPGPRMLTKNPDTVVLIIWSLALANVLGALACVCLSQWVAKLCTIDPAKLVPFLLVIMMLGAYQSTRHWGDLIAFVIIGLIGWVMKQLSWPRAPLLIGFVLSGSVERYLWISLERFQWDWITRPGVIAIGILTIGLVYLGARVKNSGIAMENTHATS